ncbi:MAG: hypothetical protein Q8Q38_02480 [bacterium]|nr:hypothetical protein [bacterium]
MVAKYSAVQAALQRFEGRWGVRPEIDKQGQLIIRGTRFARFADGASPADVVSVINEICDEG